MRAGCPFTQTCTPSPLMSKPSQARATHGYSVMSATLNYTATHMTHLSGHPYPRLPLHTGPLRQTARHQPRMRPQTSGVQQPPSRSQRRPLARLQPARCMHTCRRAGDRSQCTCATMAWICVCAETCACDVQQHITHRGGASQSAHEPACVACPR